MDTTPAMTMAEALGSMPDFVLETLGEKALYRCLLHSGLSSSLLNSQDGYVPQLAIDTFLDAFAQISGDEHVGLHLVPILGVHEYGLWGEYIFAAPDLGSALSRAISTIGLHANEDTLEMYHRHGRIHFRYTFGERSLNGYDNVAFAAAATVLSIPRHYHGPNWRPLYIALDIRKPASSRAIEDVFQCPVQFDHDCIEVVFSDDNLWTQRRSFSGQRSITLLDLLREYRGGPPTSYSDIVASAVGFRLGTEELLLDQVACSLHLSTRTLQRRLAVEGTDFRTVVLSVRHARAVELLTGSDLSVTEISTEMGYSTPGHFTRAFKKTTGRAPTSYRQGLAKYVDDTPVS